MMRNVSFRLDFTLSELVHSLLVALHPSLTAGVRATVSFLCALRVQLFIAEPVG